MPGHAHLGSCIALLFCCLISNAEAGMNKCTDGRQITYTNEPCEKMGLNSAGPIKDAVTVVHFLPKTQGDPSGKSGKDGVNGDGPARSNAQGNDSSADVHRDAAIKPASSLANRLLER